MRSLHSPSLRPLHALLQDQLAVRSSFLFAFLDSSYSRPCQVEVEFDESLWDTDGCGDHRSNLCIGCIMAKMLVHHLDGSCWPCSSRDRLPDNTKFWCKYPFTQLYAAIQNSCNAGELSCRSLSIGRTNTAFCGHFPSLPVLHLCNSDIITFSYSRELTEDNFLLQAFAMFASVTLSI